MIKRALCLLLTLALLGCMFTACGADTDDEIKQTTQSAWEPDTTQSGSEATEEETLQAEAFVLDRERVVLVSEGETFSLYTGSIDPGDITWTVDDPTVATVELGVVTAVSGGETVIRAAYRGQSAECAVVCNIETTTQTQPATEPEETEPVTTEPEVTEPEVTEPEATSSASSDPRAPVLAPPTNFVVDGSFFDDAAFVGDSISLMLSNYCDVTRALGNATFLVRGSYGVGNEVVANYHIVYQGVETLLENALADCGAKKVFIMLGMNDIALYGIDTTIEHWGMLLQRIRAKLPNIEIYIQSMTPIWTGGEVGGLNNPNVEKYNERLQAFAQENGCKYIDVASYMKDSTGGLASSYCSDNYVHLTETGAQAWIDVLKAYTGY